MSLALKVLASAVGALVVLAVSVRVWEGVGYGWSFVVTASGFLAIWLVVWRGRAN
jgi:hypothetical protein